MALEIIHSHLQLTSLFVYWRDAHSFFSFLLLSSTLTFGLFTHYIVRQYKSFWIVMNKIRRQNKKKTVQKYAFKWIFKSNWNNLSSKHKFSRMSKYIYSPGIQQISELLLVCLLARPHSPVVRFRIPFFFLSLNSISVFFFRFAVSR